MVEDVTSLRGRAGPIDIGRPTAAHAPDCHKATTSSVQVRSERSARARGEYVLGKGRTACPSPSLASAAGAAVRALTAYSHARPRNSRR